ncbi:OsmC/Ohr family protein [Candidatus Hydrogenisulfobacillus filiaventi]|uniref:OsmC/Ohr family protein n=1 Tax=Candidatus Hydrogenisulfobacillus filiaventi TaxID=2707344 RepID=A0A6F8ZJE0_9FIRM|nr:OsmC family protein [Bacillota bacterium]CAB1129791.1 OsmC/Ohr family protein [Candidatus Hydrogenisulfobacillus filiaventi]
MTTARVRYDGGMKFSGMGGSGHVVLMDAAPEVGGTDAGTRPMELTLVSLGGCTGMDVVSILRKMRVAIDAFDVDIDADRAPQHPKVYTEIRMRYRLQSADATPEQLMRAVRLSQEKYCSVSAMLRETARIVSEVFLNGSLIGTLEEVPTIPAE